MPNKIMNKKPKKDNQTEIIKEWHNDWKYNSLFECFDNAETSIAEWCIAEWWLSKLDAQKEDIIKMIKEIVGKELRIEKHKLWTDQEWIAQLNKAEGYNQKRKEINSIIKKNNLLTI